MKKLFSLISVFVAGIAVSLSAQAPQPQILPMDSAVRMGVLDNGLTYYIRHNDEPKDRCEFHIAQAVGATLEEDHQDGLAHFLEHMAFNGTKNFPDKLLLTYFESIGVNFGGDINAYTSLDETVYRLSNVPTYREGILDSALLAMHDWSSAISLQHKEIDNERGVIREEWRQGQNANRRMWAASMGQKFPGTRYAERDVIGDTAIINNFTYKAITDYYHQWYGPDLQAIVVVGDIDVDKMEKKLVALFSKIPARETRGVRPTFPLGDNAEPIVARTTDVEGQYTMSSVDIKLGEMPKEFKLTDQGYAMYLMNNLFSTMMGYRFAELAQSPEGSMLQGAAYYGKIAGGSGVTEGLSFYNVAKAGQEAKSFGDLITELERLRRYGFTVSELERAKVETLASYEKYYNERDTRKSQTIAQECYRHYLDGAPMPGVEFEYDYVKQMLPNVNVAMLNQMYQSFITDKNVILSIQGPEKEGVLIPSKEEMLKIYADVKASEIAAPKEDKIDRPLVENAPAKAGKIKKETKNEVLGTTEWTLSNGVKVVFKPTTFKNDEIRMTMKSKGGLNKVATADLPSATFAADIVTYNGLGTFSMLDLQKVLTGKVASVTPAISENEESLSGSSSVKDFETMLQLSYLYFSAVRKDDAAFSNLITLLSTILENKATDPKSEFQDSVQMATTTLRDRALIVNKELVVKVNQDRALEIFRERFSNMADFTVYFVGNINPEDAATRDLICLWLGGISTSKKLEKATDLGARTPKGEVKNYFSRDMEIKTATNRILYTAPLAYNLKNSLTLEMIGEILSTRYLESIREKEGGSYGVGTYGYITKLPVEQAAILMQFDTDPEKQARLMEIIHREVKTIIADGPLKTDFDKTKEIMIKSYKERIATNSYWMNIIVGYYDRDINALEYEKVMDSITPQYIKTTLKNIVDANNVIEVVMTPSK